MIDITCFSWVKLIQKSDLPSNAKYLAHYLSTYMNVNQDVAWPSQSRMETETGLARSTVNVHLARLEAAGFLVREPGNSNRNTRYMINVPLEAIETHALGGSPVNGLRSAVNGLPMSGERTVVVRQPDTNNKIITSNNKRGSARPERDELRDYFVTLGSTPDNADTMYDHFASNGWKVSGKAPMRDWKAAARNWVKRDTARRGGQASTRNRNLLDELTDTSWAN